MAFQTLCKCRRWCQTCDQQREAKNDQKVYVFFFHITDYIRKNWPK